MLTQAEIKRLAFRFEPEDSKNLVESPPSGSGSEFIPRLLRGTLSHSTLTRNLLHRRCFQPAVHVQRIVPGVDGSLRISHWSQAPRWRRPRCLLCQRRTVRFWGVWKRKHRYSVPHFAINSPLMIYRRDQITRKDCFWIHPADWNLAQNNFPGLLRALKAVYLFHLLQIPQIFTTSTDLKIMTVELNLAT